MAKRISIQMKKVLLLAPSPELAGGIARWTKHILNYYKSHQNDCNLDFLCTTQYKYSLKRSFFNRIYSGVINYFSVISEFKRQIRCSKFDVVHITTSASISLIKDLWLIKIAKKNKIRSVVHFRFGRIPYIAEKNNWEWKLLTAVIKNSDTAIVIDLRSYNTLVNVGFLNIENLPNPLADDLLDCVNNNKDIQIKPRSIAFVGQMIPTKGIFELVEVCSSIPNIKLNMYGSLPNGIKDQLFMIGGEHVEKWLNIYGEINYDLIIGKMKESSVFVLPTYTEGFPNVILESMACGCAIIASSVGAIPEMLAVETNEPCGICIEPKNKKDLKDAIEFLLNNPEVAQEYRDRAKKRVVKEYSIDSVWNKMLKIWCNETN